jgi:hypothetical protein
MEHKHLHTDQLAASVVVVSAFAATTKATVGVIAELKFQ